MVHLLKRFFEIILAVAFLILAAPFFLVASIIVLLDSPGPLILRQQRVGKDGRVFRLYKLRTMKKGANGNLPMHTQVNDPRFSPICRFIRSTCIDEIPQLINIIRGEMAFIGPRPERPPIVEAYTPRQLDILKFTPGLFGISQIVFREGVVVADKIALELKYYESRSLFSDIKILLYTPVVLLSHMAGKVRPNKKATNHKHAWLERVLLGERIIL
ncbi:MAG TPA: sugar transferase [candidate division Zixibacteria bacterium]|nr:sugar transferase [candidate division Zixibacteria bacterium]